MKSPKQTLSRRAEALILVGLIACLGAVGLQAATQITTFDPPAATVGNARLLSLGIIEYTQDYDERLPPTQSVTAFQTAVLPFVPDQSFFVSRVTGKPFIPNPALSGQPISYIGNPTTTVVFQDVLPPSSIPDTVGFLDGHIERGGIIQGDPKKISRSNANTISLGTMQYAGDNDEHYPPMKTQAAFQAAVLPFVQNARFFIDPLNGKPFVPNPALSGVSLASVADPYHTILLQSAMPYKDGDPIIVYADGHTTPELPGNSGARDASNLGEIGLATTQFTQDHNDTLPPTADYTAFENALQPYAFNTSIFTTPATGLAYILNPAISGINYATIADPTTIEEARDAQINPDGTFNSLKLDGRVHRSFYFLPKHVAVGPDDLTHLLWPNANRQAALWTIAPGNTTKTTVSDGSYITGFSFGEDNEARVLWSLTLSTLDILEADGTVAHSTQFGPYDGWSQRLLITGADNSSRLLWRRYDGTLALWTLSPTGDFAGNMYLTQFTGLTPIGLALGTDNVTRLLGQTTQGAVRLALLSDNGGVTRPVTIPVQSGFTVTGLGLGTDGASRVLASDGKDHAVVVTVAPNGSTVSTVSFTLTGGGTASQIAVGKAGDLRVLWEAADGSGQLQTLTATGQQTGLTPLTPYM